MQDSVYLAQKTLKVFIVIAFINLIILFFTLYHIKNAPIKAVETAEKLQTNRSNSDKIYNNKFNVFATILGLRHCQASNEQFVIAINQIPIVFHENKKVLEYLDRFIKTHVDSTSPKVKVLENLSSDLNDLVLEIAKDLGYSNIDNNVMKSSYSPDASFYRYQQESIYSELYSLQSLPNLLGERKKHKNQSNDQQDPQ
jgi:hypothetical protein